MRGIKAKQLHKLALRVHEETPKSDYRRVLKTLKRSYRIGAFKIGPGWVRDYTGKVRAY